MSLHIINWQLIGLKYLLRVSVPVYEGVIDTCFLNMIGCYIGCIAPIIAQSLKHHLAENAFDTCCVCFILTTMSGSNFDLDIYCS